ncbi:helix-turn-helix domain-containing protein [Rhizobium leguminosarum]|nr:helix-turn-helix domain-containing protein [Rhizobium leguminosarum]
MHTIPASLIPAAEVRARFGNVSESTLYRWTKLGAIPRPIKIGRDLLWDTRDLEEFIAAKKAESLE